MPLSGLRVLTVSYWGFDEHVHRGQLVVNAQQAAKLAQVFRQLYALRFHIRHMAFERHVRPEGARPRRRRCHRVVRMPAGRAVAVQRRQRHRHWSEHAYGEAVDLNPRREPVRRLRHDTRQDGALVRRPLATSARDGDARGRARVRVDRLGMGRRLVRLDEGLHALLGVRPLSRRSASLPSFSHNSAALADLIRDAERLRRLQALTDAALGHLELEELLDALLDRAREMLDRRHVRDPAPRRGARGARCARGASASRRRSSRASASRSAAASPAGRRRRATGDPRRRRSRGRPQPDPAAEGDQVAARRAAARRAARCSACCTSARSSRAGSRSTTSTCCSSPATAPQSRSTMRARSRRSTRRARRLEHVQAVTDAALAHLELDELLGVLLPRIRDILARRHVRGAPARRGRDELVARAAVGIEEEVEQGVRIPVGRGFAGRVAADGAAGDPRRRRPRRRAQPDPAREGDQVDARRAADRRAATRSACSTSGRSCTGSSTGDDVELLELVAERVALAIERARLHEQVLAARPAEGELRRDRVARAANAGDLRVRRARDARRAARRARAGAARGAAAGRRRAGRAARAGCSSSCSTSPGSTRAASRVDPKPLVLHSVLAKIAADNVAGRHDCSTRRAARPRRDRRPARDRPRRLEPARRTPCATASRRSSSRPSSATGTLAIAVEDGGAGVPEELRARLFDRFARGDDAHGSGLGLSIARAYARAHGGDLVYEPTRRRLALRVSAAACLTSGTSRRACGSGACRIRTGGRGRTGGRSSRRRASSQAARSCSSIRSRRLTTRTRSGQRLDAKPPTLVVVLKPDHVRDVDVFVRRYSARAFGPYLFFRHNIPETELEPIQPGTELPGGLVALYDGRGRGETPLWVPELRTIVFADALTAPEGELRVWSDAVARGADAACASHAAGPAVRARDRLARRAGARPRGVRACARATSLARRLRRWAARARGPRRRRRRTVRSKADGRRRSGSASDRPAGPRSTRRRRCPTASRAARARRRKRPRAAA